MVQAGWWFLSETAACYAMIVIEMLGIVWAVKKCRVFLQGLRRFGMVTDHTPLLTVINKYDLNEIENPRLQRLKMKLMSYNLVATWRPDKDHLAADTLSRAPLVECTKWHARLAVYWPGIDQDIKNIVSGCQACSAELPSQAKEPLHQHPRPERVFQHMCSDLFLWAVAVVGCLGSFAEVDRYLHSRFLQECRH